MLTASNQTGMECELQGEVTVIAFNRPDRRNAMDIGMRTEYARLINIAIADERVRAIVLTGRGGHFCSGGDIGSMDKTEGISAESGRARMRSALQTVSALYTCDKPVLAAVEGCAFGGGFGIALLADFIVAAEGARFCMSFARMGLVPDSGALYTLPRIVGVQRAKELMFSAREIDAHQAHAYGIAAEVTPEGQALERALQLAHALTKTSPAAVAMTKAALNNSLSSDLRSMVETEANAQGVAFSTDYHRACVQRFLLKQPPLFRWPEENKTRN